jgi:hypothetical protein
MDEHWTERDIDDLRAAKRALESPSFIATVTGLLGKPISAGLKRLPPRWNEKVDKVAHAALMQALSLAVRTTRSERGTHSSDVLHKVLVTVSGAAGGSFGTATAAVELPISTCIILRSIIDIAKHEGHDVAMLAVRLSCVEVFALGSSQKSGDDSSQQGYWVVRAALAREIADAMNHIASKGLGKRGAPPLLRLVSTIAARFSTVVTEEMAAKLVPVIGAAAGGAINLLFMQHFQTIAHGHFTVKRLEKKYESEAVQRKYQELHV